MNAETRAHITRMERTQQLEIADNLERLSREFKRASYQRRHPENAGRLTYRPFEGLRKIRKIGQNG